MGFVGDAMETPSNKYLSIDLTNFLKNFFKKWTVISEQLAFLCAKLVFFETKLVNRHPKI